MMTEFNDDNDDEDENVYDDDDGDNDNEDNDDDFRIWQCSDGHPVCEFCRKKPQVCFSLALILCLVDFH